MGGQEMSVQEDEPLIMYTEYELTILPSGVGIVLLLLLLLLLLSSSLFFSFQLARHLLF